MLLFPLLASPGYVPVRHDSVLFTGPLLLLLNLKIVLTAILDSLGSPLGAELGVTIILTGILLPLTLLSDC